MGTTLSTAAALNSLLREAGGLAQEIGPVAAAESALTTLQALEIARCMPCCTRVPWVFTVHRNAEKLIVGMTAEPIEDGGAA